MSAATDLAIVIPALNESATIAEVIGRAVPFGRVIVVDDGSTDGTAETARAAGATVVSHPANRGYDQALESGFREADRLGCAAVITVDADGEHDPSLLADFAAALQEVPLVLGIRPRKQRLAEVIAGWYFRYRFGIRDILCGMKGYRIGLYRENGGFDHCLSIGTELALNSIRRGHPFRQVAVGGRRRQGKPRFDTILRANLRILRALWRTSRSLTRNL